MIRNSTIIPKKRKLDCGCYDFAFSKNRCKQHATIESTKQRVEKYEAEQAGNNDEEESVKNLIEDLDWVTSRITRISASDEDGNCPCFTCPTVKHFTLMQSGHYISRSHMGLRFLDTNQKPQCEVCNCYKHGNLDVYKERLEALQPGLPEWLMEQSRQVEKPSKYELKILLTTLRQKLKVVESKLKK